MPFVFIRFRSRALEPTALHFASPSSFFLTRASSHRLSWCTSKPLRDHSCSHGDDSGVRCLPSRSQWEFKFVNSTIPTLFRPTLSYLGGLFTSAPTPPAISTQQFLCDAPCKTTKLNPAVANPCHRKATRNGCTGRQEDEAL